MDIAICRRHQVVEEQFLLYNLIRLQGGAALVLYGFVQKIPPHGF